MNPYVLPTISFVGGETQILSFNAYFNNSTQPFSVAGCTARFSVVNYLNRFGTPVIIKTMSAASGESNVLTVTLSSSDTLSLSGKYIYQISIKDGSGNADIPKQGLMYITNNIDKDFLST